MTLWCPDPGLQGPEDYISNIRVCLHHFIAEMETLWKIQAAAQGWLTRVVKNMDVLLAMTPPATTSELVEILEEFDKRLTESEEVQSDIELEISSDELEDYLDMADVNRQLARQRRLFCANKLKELTVGDKDSTDAVNSTTSLRTKLPKLKLP